MSIGGLVFASGLPGCARAAPPARAGAVPAEDFFFLQLSDTHWGFEGAPNPHADVTLERAIATINAAEVQPAFVVFTGDLTHTTDDPNKRRERMKRFRELASTLRVKEVRYLAGEHDASLDRGEAYRETFGEPTYAFERGGVHFIALDNASLPGGELGEGQLAWLVQHLATLPAEGPVVVLAHRPLFPLYPQWEWATRDGARALEILARRPNVTVFYGHIHQEHHFKTGAVWHHAARSLVFPLPPPGSVAKKAALPWNENSEDHGLGWRRVDMATEPRLTEVVWK